MIKSRIAFIFTSGLFQICASYNEVGWIVGNWKWMMNQTQNIIVKIIECLQCANECTLIHSIQMPFSSSDRIFQSVYLFLPLLIVQITLYMCVCVCLWNERFFFLLLHILNPFVMNIKRFEWSSAEW